MLDISCCPSRCPAVPPFLHLALWLTWIMSTGSSWAWPMGSTCGRSKGGRRTRLAYLKRAHLVLHHRSDPVHTTLSRFRFLQAFPTLIPSGTEVLPCFPIISLRGLDFMIYLYPACTFENIPFITLSSKFLIWVHHLFLARLWLMQAMRVTWP